VADQLLDKDSLRRLARHMSASGVVHVTSHFPEARSGDARSSNHLPVLPLRQRFRSIAKRTYGPGSGGRGFASARFLAVPARQQMAGGHKMVRKLALAPTPISREQVTNENDRG
jgi:hypothetical protein